MKNTFLTFLLLLLAMLALIAALWILPPLEMATGMDHPEFATMRHSGTSVAADTSVKWLSYFFGLGIIGIWTCCLLVGAYKTAFAVRRKIYRAIGIGIAIYVLVYTIMLFLYWQYAAGSTLTIVVGLPIPTAWMVYVFWFTPALITLLYIFKFDTYVLTGAELEQFQQIVAARKARNAKEPQ
ncbi:MAG: hypothetical protein AAFO94_02680 [Bacteroidota bacterium]